MTNLKALDLTDYELDDSDSEDDDSFINNRTLPSFVNLEYLKLDRIFCNPYHSIKKLVNLKELDFSEVAHCRADLEEMFGPNLNIIDHLKKLELFSLYRLLEDPQIEDFLEINQIQLRYPHVRFRWFIDAGECGGYYEGTFSDNNLMEGKGKIEYEDGDIYEGEFKNDKKEGKGILYDCNTRYEGEFKNDLKEGKGIYYSPKRRHEGEYKNNRREGHGIYFSPHRRYEGEFKNGFFEGHGIVNWPNGSRFEGEFKDGSPYFGTMYYSYGDRYVGAFSKIRRDGKGVVFYSNGNRFEGNFDDDYRVGEGVFYYSNGEKVEGDETKFILDDNEGTIELV